MIKQCGYTLTELLVSLLLVSMISSALMQMYLANKRQYLLTQKQLEQHWDLQWIEELLSNAFRHAGFTPCLNVEQLQTIDRRDFYKKVQAIQIVDQHSLKINRMKEVFAKVVEISNSTEIVISEPITLTSERPVIIADCEHAEIQHIQALTKISNGWQVTLSKPLVFKYHEAYLGEWIEEHWFVKAKGLKNRSLYYHSLATEELSTLIHSLTVTTQHSQSNPLFKVTLQSDAKQSQSFVVASRNL